MKIIVSKNRYVTQNCKTLQPVEEDWNTFIEDFRNPKVYSISFNEYHKKLNEFYLLESQKNDLTNLEKSKRKVLKSEIDALKFVGGYYFGGTFEGNTRGNAVTSKSLITLDIDNIPQDMYFIAQLQQNEYLSKFEYIVHSTAKHIPQNHQRYRLIIPLLEPITDDISLKYECITRHIANLIMDIKYFDSSAFVDNHLMLYPVIAQSTPTKYYTFYHNKTEKFLNPNTILEQYNYHDRYTFQGVERSSVPEQPPTAPRMYSSSDSLITSNDKDRIRVLIAQELQENGINAPDTTNFRKKFGCVCGSSDACNFGRGYMCNCFSSNHDTRLGKQGNGVYTYDIFDLYAYTHNLDTSRDFIKIAFELSRKYNIILDNAEQVERFLYKPTALDDFKGIEVSSMPDVVAHQNGVGENSTIEEMSRPGVVDWVSYLDYDRYDRVKNTLNNIDLILRNDSEFSGKIQYNEFTCRKQFERENWTDKDDSRIKLYIERKYGIKNVTVDNIVHACNILTDENKYHPIKDYLNGLKWDGVNRIETLFIDFLGAKDNEYTRKVAKITLISAIARIYNPGCKVDTVTCLVGSQGIGKSKFISKISVNPDWFTDSVSSFDGKEFYETIQGKWIVEIGEGTAFKKSLKETAKQKIASQQDTYRTPYARYVEDRPRQCIFIATTNSYDFLKDETGDRRYYPIDCEKKKARLSIDKNLNKEYISQLWAEAKELYTRGEEVYITDERIINLAEQEQKAHFDESPLQSDIYNFLDILLPPLSDWYSWGLDRRRRYIQAVQSGEDTSKSLGVSGVYRRDRVSVKEIMCELYNYDLNQPIDRKLSLDVTRSLTALGWSKSGKSLRIKPYGKVWIYEKY